MALFVCANAVHTQSSQPSKLHTVVRDLRSLQFHIVILEGVHAARLLQKPTESELRGFLGKIGALKLIAFRQKALGCLQIYGVGSTSIVHLHNTGNINQVLRYPSTFSR